MTPNSAGNDHLPVYDSLVRERGDVVAEARVVAEQAQRQAAQAIHGHPGSAGWGVRPVAAEGGG